MNSVCSSAWLAMKNMELKSLQILGQEGVSFGNRGWKKPLPCGKTTLGSGG